MIALSPENPRSKIIHTLSERFNKEQVVEMKKWEPKEKNIFPASYDFEWFVEEEKQCPYAYGMFWNDGKYLSHHKTDGIYASFVENLYKMAEDVYTHQYIPEM